MIKPKKQQTDFRFTYQGSKHDKNKVAIRFLKKRISKFFNFSTSYI